MHYSYIYERKYDKEGYYKALQELINDLGAKKFDKLTYKIKVREVELRYLSHLLVEIFLSLSEPELKDLLNKQDQDTKILLKPHKSRKGGKD